MQHTAGDLVEGSYYSNAAAAAYAAEVEKSKRDANWKYLPRTIDLFTSSPSMYLISVPIPDLF